MKENMALKRIAKRHNEGEGVFMFVNFQTLALKVAHFPFKLHGTFFIVLI